MLRTLLIGGSFIDARKAGDSCMAVALIGGGAYGAVYEGTFKDTPVALKCLTEKAWKNKAKTYWEINALEQCKGHFVHVIRLLDVFVCQQPPVVCSVFESLGHSSQQVLGNSWLRPSWPATAQSRSHNVHPRVAGLVFLTY